ncbi:Holliday junction resolvase RusA-like endonuclease [Bradyrhizobium sp. USDA 4341]
MARISTKDAERLGLIPGADGRVSTARRIGLRRSDAPRAHAKRGRLRVSPESGPPISFFVPIEPIPKARARTMLPKSLIEKCFVQSRGNLLAFRGLIDKLKHHTYTPERTAAFEKQVALHANRAMAGRPAIERPLAMQMTFVFEGDETLWPTDSSDGDMDNLVKAIKDALNGIAYKDDRLVVLGEQRKICGREFGVHVTCTPL